MGGPLHGLGSFVGGMAFAAAGAVLLVVGFGLGLALEGRYRRWVLPALAAIIALAPPLGVLLAVALAVALLVLELRVGTGIRSDFASAVEASRKGREISELSGRTRIWMIALEVWRQNPLFGHGPTIWSEAFRATWRVPAAFHAHNQFLQSLGAAGIVGVLGLLAYLGALIVGALRAARASRGLAPALVAVMLVRMATEVPLEMSTVLLGDFLFQLTTFVAVLGYLLRAERLRLAPASSRGGSRRPGRRRRRSSAPGSSSGPRDRAAGGMAA